MSGRRRGTRCDKTTARDIVRGVTEELIGPHHQVHRAATPERNSPHGE